MLALINYWPKSTMSSLGDTAPPLKDSPTSPKVSKKISPQKKYHFKILQSSTERRTPCFGDFHVYHKDWLTYSGGTDRPGELCSNLK